MLSHCYAHSSFLVLQWLESLNLKRAMGEITNYRRMALHSLLSAIFDNCIISNQHDSVFTNNFKFAYKLKLLQFFVYS